MKTFQLEEIQEAQEDYCGFCLECGHMQAGVEPDAVGYKCEECGAKKVCGPDEILLLGAVR